MTKLKRNESANQNWLDWCRLCAKEDAAINVRQKDSYMRMISKCFDVEIEFEQPQLGGMLCAECYHQISEIIHFTESVNKAQPIFELLRHIEPNEPLDVPALRHEYGLQNKNVIKMEPPEPDLSTRPEASMDSNISKDDEKSFSQNSIYPKRKRGRPKGSKTKNRLPKYEDRQPKPDPEPIKPVDSDHEYKKESPVDWLDDSSSNFEGSMADELVENHMWLEEMQDNERDNLTNNRRGRPKKSIKSETHDESIDEEELSMEASNIETKSPIELDNDTVDYSIESEQAGEESISIVQNEIVFKRVKKKRGRPRKNAKVSNEVPKSTNSALARLLLESPEPESHMNPEDIEFVPSVKHPVSCNICNKLLASDNSLKVHIDNVHNKKKPFICDICGKRVPTTSSLKEHMLVHTDERPFVCDICNAGFKNQKRLNIHSQTHGEPSFECEICGKKLQTRAIWHKHKYVHNNVRRFECRVCGTTHKHSTALKVHLLSHAGFRPYACKYCSKSFASGANCKEHKMKHHPIEFAKDDDKSSRVQSVPTLDELRAIAERMEKTDRLRKPRKMRHEFIRK